MSDPNSADAQMTPEARAIIARARRSFLFSIGLLIVGFIAIGGVLVYRSVMSGGNGTPSGSDYSLAAVKLPQGAEVVSAVASDGRISVTYRNGSTTSIRIFDGRTGEIVREIPILGE